MSSTDKVNQLYEKYKDKFPNSFLHNLLWKLLVEKNRKLTDASFTPVIKNGHTELGIADKNERGYSPTGIVFESHKYDEQVKICQELNQDVFGIDANTASLIVLSSMRK